MVISADMRITQLEKKSPITCFPFLNKMLLLFTFGLFTDCLTALIFMEKIMTHKHTTHTGICFRRRTIWCMVLSLSDLLSPSLFSNQFLFSVWPSAFLSFFQWATVTFHLPHHVLKVVTSAIVSELRKINQNVAALSVASSIMDRLSYLLSSARPELGVGPGRSVDRWASSETDDI